MKLSFAVIDLSALGSWDLLRARIAAEAAVDPHFRMRGILGASMAPPAAFIQNLGHGLLAVWSVRP